MVAPTHPQQVSPVVQEQYDLVKGNFSPQEATEIITELFSSKIKFHSAQSFSQERRFGTKDLTTEQRISELQSAQQQALKLIDEAKASGKSLRISSTILIELV